MSVCVELFALTYLWSSIYIGGLRNMATSALVVIAISATNYSSFYKPKIIFDEDGIEIGNPLSRDFIAWSDVSDIDARWCMSITTGDRVIHAYGAPAPGRHRSRNVHETEMRGIKGGETGFMRPARSPKSDSGVAVHIASTWRDKHAGTKSARASEHRREVAPLVITISAVLVAIAINVIR